jgi:phosphonopyruvate decarboxylase
MVRTDALRTLSAHYAGQPVVSVYTTCFEWLAIRPDALNYVAVGAMGQAGSHALGLAIGCPDLEVWVLDGDGSLLMNLGSLVTLAGSGVRNLVHVVFQNGSYEANGCMPLPVQQPVDFAAIARAAGIEQTGTFDEVGALKAWLGARRAGSGPAVLDLRVIAGPTPILQRYEYIHSAQARAAFRSGLADALAAAAKRRLQ